MQYAISGLLTGESKCRKVVETRNKGNCKMAKLLAKYKAEPNEKNLAVIKKHLQKHPMAAIQLTLEESRIFG